MRCAIRLIGYLVMAMVAICAGVVVYKMMYPDTKEPFFYNTYNRSQISTALKDETLSLDEYCNIMNSTQNLRTMSLQELCGNWILGCDSQDRLMLHTRADVRKWGKQIAGAKIVECAQKKDWYRLAMILMKYFDSECAVDPNYVQWFERTPTNGVFGVESVRMMKNREIYPMWRLPPIPEIAVTQLDTDDLYKEYVDEVYRPFRVDLSDKVDCEKRKPLDQRCELLSIPLFCKLGCVMLREMMSGQ